MSNQSLMRKAKLKSVGKLSENEKKMDELIPIEEDPFENGDDSERDQNYTPSPKKRKVHSEKLKLKTTKDRVLTPKERIMRLKNKTEKYEANKQSSNSVSAENSAINKTATKGLHNYDAFFVGVQSTSVNNSNLDPGKANSSTSNTSVTILQEEVTNSEAISLSHKMDSICELSTTERFKESSNMENSQMARMLLSLVAKVEQLTDEVHSMRRQMARMEAKSTLNSTENGASRIMDREESVFLNYDASLLAEGLPVRNVDDVERLETKLKQQPYRQKLVMPMMDLHN